MFPVPKFKHIPQPRFEHVPIDLHGMSDLEQVIWDREHAPSYKLIEDWIITLEDGTQFVFPQGFVTDFASVPRAMHALILPDGALYLGAILHDFGYQHGYLLAVREEGRDYEELSWKLFNFDPKVFGPYMPVYVGYPQEWFDQLLRDVTIWATGATVQAEEGYAALRLAGCVAWNNYREKGPGAYGTSSLGLPGVISRGPLYQVL